MLALRHGQSEWNKSNQFTGWVDVDLTEEGRKEAISAGKILKKANISVDLVYTSLLKRAIKTAWLALEEMDQCSVPFFKDWRLNERHYGALQGKNKSETVAAYGEEQVKIWRRSYDIQPPKLEIKQPLPRFCSDLREVPACESLKNTIERVLPYWKTVLFPQILKGQTIMIVAHGNSLRALVKELTKMTDTEIVSLEIPTAKPLEFLFDEQGKFLSYQYISN